MKASRNTILAGLMLLALTAGKPVLGSSIGSGNPSCDASCGTCGKTSGEASCGSTCTSNCNAGCNAGCQTAGTTACNTNCKPENSCHDPDSSGCGKATCGEDDQAFGPWTPYFNDLCETCRSCSVKVEVSALFIHRATPGTQTVLLDPTSGVGLYDASRLEFPYATGPRVSVTALDCEGWGFEVNYFGIDGWSATSDVPNGSLPSGTANLIVDDINQISLTDAHFESIARLYSTEINFRRPLFGNISCLAGFRWMELTDKYLAEGTSATTGNTVSDVITTRNNLYGFQVGADGKLGQEADRWKITGFVKGGIFLNNAEQATFLSDPGNLGSFALNNNQNCATFFGETGIIGYFQITKHVSASGGYQVMFINGVAQPANQLSGTSLANYTATLDVSSGLFYHGATAGLEVTW